MKNFTKVLLLCGLIVSGVMLFQAQDFNGHKFDDTNPMIDQPTREAYSHFHSPTDMEQQDVITDAQGFDNFNISVDFAEQHMTSNPNNPLWVFFGVNGSSSPPQNARYTTDGGLNWGLNNPLYPAGTCCDPWSAYTGNGYLIYGSGVTGQYVYRSTNGGVTWLNGGVGVLSVSGNDRNTLAAEESGTGPYANYVYAAITPGNFARSTDLGETWTTTYGSANNIPGVMIAVGPNGSTNGGCVIYVTNNGATQNVIYTFHRSTDGGQSFQVMSSIAVAGFVGTLNGVGRLVINNARTRPYPMIAMDNSNGTYRGRLYLVYASNDPPGDGNKPDIKLQYSTDQGLNWSTPVIVNDNSNPQQSDQWFPAIWCERTTGKLYIKWYDDRENPAAYSTGVWGTYTTDGGQTFAPNQKISNANFTYPCPACGPNQNCYRGDYDGITANPLTSMSVWYDARQCNFISMAGYFPDFALKVRPTADSLNSIADTADFFVSVPAVKLYTDKVKFTATVTPPPGTGTITMLFLNKTSNIPQDSLTSYPDSLRLRVIAAGNVTAGNYTVRVTGNGSNGTPVHIRDISLFLNPLIGITNISNEVPGEFYLYQNFPNPFNPKTNIRFDIAKSGIVKLKVYDITGRQVSELLNKEFTAGKYMFDFDASHLASGVYFYRLETPDFADIKKMILVK